MLLHEQRKPIVNFVIPGAQKSGTTALRYYLRQHPQIFMPAHEVHFFDRNRFETPLMEAQEYEKEFPADHREKLVGDCTPIYLFWDDCIRRLSTYNPQIKLIILLRDPVERAYSQWKMNFQRGIEPMKFSDALKHEARRTRNKNVSNPRDVKRYSYVERGRYGKQISNASQYVSLEQMLFLKTDSLKYNHDGALSRVCNFLCIEPFEQTPIFEIVRPTILSQMGAGLLDLEEGGHSVIDESCRRLIREQLADDISELKSVTGIDFSSAH